MSYRAQSTERSQVSGGPNARRLPSLGALPSRARLIMVLAEHLTMGR